MCEDLCSTSRVLVSYNYSSAKIMLASVFFNNFGAIGRNNLKVSGLPGTSI